MPKPTAKSKSVTSAPEAIRTREPEPAHDQGGVEVAEPLRYPDDSALAPPPDPMTSLLESEPADLSDLGDLDEREISRRLRERNAEISQLAGGLAHEIRNPLSTLSLNLDLLAEDFEDAESPRDRRVLQRIGRLRAEVHRLNDILESFLRFARIQELKLEPTNLNVLVDELRDFYEPQATTQGIVVRVFAAANLPAVVLDVDLFKQALLNLMLNAEHALLPEGGELILSTRQDGARVILDVTDTGKGMSDELCSKVFDAFYSTRKGGTGLGLPIARKIVESCGGTISVRSEPGKGSQFTIRLPIAPRQPAS